GFERAFGLSLDAPGQLPLWAVILARSVAAALLVVAGVAALRRWRADRWPAALVLALPAVVVAALIVLAAVGQDSLPVLLDSAAQSQLRRDPEAPLFAASGIALVTLQALIGICFLGAAALSYQLFRRDRRGVDAYLAIGFTLAAFSQLHGAIHPGAFGSVVTTGDLLRVAFYAVLLIALAAESRGDVRQLHEANLELIRLREADMARATAEERARLAREIHDGMSQELWFAKLKQGRLLQLPDLSSGARGLGEEVAGAIESALAEARQAILALRPTEGATFGQVIERYVEDFADRFGIPAVCRSDPAAEGLSSRSQAELLRIVQEALNNTRKHADATRVQVEVEATPSGLRLTVSDNGRGFEPDTTPSRGYGLRSMQERAGLIGATLAIDSRPQDGTRVIIEVPVVEPAR
ncbi:MAG TPA: sensor histidine kinase, partial [Candidatus Dormibacteraeota bacterium]|nr:sensor histidine kinase [Candidatus Dormibacteraeota bacterium]